MKVHNMTNAPMTGAERRRTYRAYQKERDRIAKERQRLETQYAKAWFAAWPYGRVATPVLPDFPDPIFAGLTCEAKTRAGTPCKRRDLHNNLRCRLHGGLSTGPKTKAGKAKAAMNGAKRGEPHER